VTTTGPESGLIVEIPAAEAVVGPYRERLDQSAALGVPAHITVLYPFIPPGQLDAGVLSQLAQLFTAVPRFGFRLDGTDWFGQEVLWLAPSDPAPFRALTQHVVEAFPAYPPYGGDFPDTVPHLTIGDAQNAGDLRDAEESIAPLLPIIAEATAVTLITQELPAGPFTRSATFPLA
jgi:hypothetical protein